MGEPFQVMFHINIFKIKFVIWSKYRRLVIVLSFIHAVVSEVWYTVVQICRSD